MTENLAIEFSNTSWKFFGRHSKKIDHLMDDSLTPIIDLMTKFFTFHPKRIDCCPKTFVTI